MNIKEFLRKSVSWQNKILKLIVAQAMVGYGTGWDSPSKR